MAIRFLAAACVLSLLVIGVSCDSHRWEDTKSLYGHGHDEHHADGEHHAADGHGKDEKHEKKDAQAH